MFTKRGWKGWIWPALLAMAIVLASGRSKLASPDIVGIDKASHFLVFGLLGILVARNGFLPRFGWLAVLAVSVFGLTDEWHQSFTPGRDVEVADWIADTLGAAVAVGLYSRWLWFSRLLETPLAGPHDRVEKSADIVPDTEVHETR